MILTFSKTRNGFASIFKALLNNRLTLLFCLISAVRNRGMVIAMNCFSVEAKMAAAPVSPASNAHQQKKSTFAGTMK